MKSTISQLLLPLAVATVLPASAKLVAWYPLDESSVSTGTVVTENVVGNDAAMIGFDADPTLSSIERGHPAATQALGTSYLINSGSMGGALQLGTNSAVQPTDQFTYTCFFQPSAFSAFDRLFESLDGNDANQSGVRIDLASQGNRVRFLVRDGSGSTAQVTHGTTLKNDGTWYFCAFRYDSTSAASTPLRATVLELDGSPIDDAAIAAATSGPATIATGTIGATHGLETIIGANSAAGGGFALQGAIDELAFYDNSDSNGVLSDADLALNAQFGPSGVELITSFSSDVLSTSPGNPVTFTWNVTPPFGSLVLEDENGNVTDLAPLTTAGMGSTMVSPASTTTYYLKGVNGAVQNTHAITILSGAAPVISNFAASAPVVQTGSTVNLNWATIGATSITLDPGMMNVSALTTSTVTINADTTFTLTATNGFGSTTADVTVGAFNGTVPAHIYNAGTATNTDGNWLDEIVTKNMNGTGLIREAPLLTASANTNIAGAYSAASTDVGATVGAFQFPQSTFEIWLRPGALNADHGVVFETGGGQNGLGILINQDGLRFIGSLLDVRNLDLVVPISGLNLNDFIQVVCSHDTTSDAFSVSVRDTFGNVLTDTATAAVAMGGNGATVFNYGSGGIQASVNNLGGRTEAAGADPAGLTGFVGEIGIIHVYDQILDATQIQAAFDAVATTTTPPAGGQNAITDIDYDGTSAVTLTWNSDSGKNYDAEFSSDLQNWFPINDPVAATAASTTKTYNIPPNQPKFFLRIIEVAAP